MSDGVFGFARRRAVWGMGLLACLWIGAVALDAAQRASPPAIAQAVWPQGAETVKVHDLQRDAVGFLPMADGAFMAHASNLLAMPPGDSAVVSAFWFTGDRESAPNVRIAASQFDRATQKWLPARYVVDRLKIGQQLGFGLRRLGNPVAWRDATGRIHLFVVATGAGGWAAGRVLHLRQNSAGSALRDFNFDPVGVLPLSWLWNTSFLVRNNPLPLADGGMLLPMHFELGLKYPVAARFDAQGHFVGFMRISARKHLLQPTLIVQSATEWRALMRSQQPDGHIAQAITHDAGRHWEDLPDLPQVNPDSALQGLALNASAAVLAHNSSPHSRAVLDLSASEDGAQWFTLQNLMRAGDLDEYSYPSMVWADGELWITYTDHRRHIGWQRFKAASARSVASSGGVMKP